MSSPEDPGPYELLLELAVGGMATVHIGRRRVGGAVDRIVAIKRLRPSLREDAEKHAGLMDEARIASLINHVNVVSVQDVLELADEKLLVMSYVDGVALSALVEAAARRQRLLPRGVALRIVVDALRGLHAAHEQSDHTGQPLGIVHRDATPQNILVGADGVTRVTDFGIARALGRSVQTEDGRIKGKFRYMAPEQARGAALDRRVDVFAMGVVAFEVLTGKRLIDGNQMQSVYRLSTGDVPEVQAVAPELPAELGAILQESLRVDLEARTKTAEQLADALEAWARTEGELATASDVARVVEELSGTLLAERRRRIRQVVGGSSEQTARPAPVPLPPTTDAPDAPEPRGQRPLAAPPLRRKASPALLGAVAGLVVGAAALAWLSWRWEREAPVGGASHGASAGSPAPSERVKVRVTSGAPIRSVTAPGMENVVASAHGVALELPRSSERVSLRVVFADGSEVTEDIVPAGEVAVSLRAPEPTAPPPVTSVRGVSPAPTPGGKPGGILKGNPYER